MADVSKLNADGVIYNIKDDVARRQVEKTRVDFQGTLDNEYYNKGKIDDLINTKADKATTDEIREDLDKLNSGGLIIKDNVIKDNINNWLNEHPEATTTVQDGTISESKIEANLLSKISRNGFLSVIDFKAKGNGATDDTNAFTDCINCAKAKNKNIFIPAGTYVITGDLPTIPAGIVIAGEDVGQAAYIDKSSVTTIIDARNSTEYLFRQASDDSSRNGGEIRNIYFQNSKLNDSGVYVANEDGNGYCLDIYRGGWDGLISNCTFVSYRTALRKGGNDYRVNNCKFHKCGTLVDSDSIDYAVELVDSCNETLFNSCHFEHCRFFVRVANTVRNTTNMCFNNAFNSCKFESSMKGIGINSSLSPIYVKSNHTFTPVSFMGCRFVQMDIDAYPHDNTYSNIPYFMDITNCKVNASQFVCGFGSSTVAYTKSNNALYLNAKKSKISDCTFLKAAKQISPITLNGSQFTNNHIQCGYVASDNDITAEELIYYETNSVVENNTYEGVATGQMAMQRFMSRYDFVGSNITSMPALTPFGYNRCYRGYKTIAIRLTGTTFIGPFGVTLQNPGTNSAPVGRFVVKLISTPATKTAAIVSQNEMIMNGKTLQVDVHFMNDNLIYIQFPEYNSSNAYNVVIDGLEACRVNAYIASIGDAITDSVKSVSLLLE